MRLKLEFEVACTAFFESVLMKFNINVLDWLLTQDIFGYGTTIYEKVIGIDSFRQILQSEIIQYAR